MASSASEEKEPCTTRCAIQKELIKLGLKTEKEIHAERRFQLTQKCEAGEDCDCAFFAMNGGLGCDSEE